jgi:hypothetical protein
MDKTVSIKLALGDEQAKAGLEDIAARLDKLTTGFRDIKVRVDDAQARLQLDTLGAKLFALSSKTVTPEVSLSGYFRTLAQIDRLDIAMDRLNAKSAGGGIMGFLRGLGGNTWGSLIGGGGTAGTAGTAAAGTAPFWATPAGVAAIGAGVVLGSPLIVSAIGGIVGAAGAAGALVMASRANTALTALQATQTTAQDALTRAQASQQFHPSAANAAALAAAQANAAQANAAVTQFQAGHGPALGLYAAEQGLGSAAGTVFGNALTANATRQVAARTGHVTSPLDSITQPIAGTNFLSGLEGILKQISGWIVTIQKPLGDMFRAALPYLHGWVQILEGFAGRIMPAVTSALQNFARFMPDIVHLFNGLSDVVSAVIRVFGWLADSVGMTFQGFQRFGKGVKGVWDQFGHDMANWAQDTENWIGNVVNWFLLLPGKIIDALSGLGGKLFTAGVNAIQRLIDGFTSMIGHVGSAIGSIASKIAGFFGLSPAVEGPLSGAGDPLIRGQHFADSLAAGMASRTGALGAAARGLAYAAVPGAGGYGSSGGGWDGKITLEITGGDAAFRTWLKNSIRVHGGNPNVIGV